jgi:hypothetical protein
LPLIATYLEAAEKVTHESTKVVYHAGLSIRIFIPALQLADTYLICALYFAHRLLCDIRRVFAIFSKLRLLNLNYFELLALFFLQALLHFEVASFIFGEL